MTSWTPDEEAAIDQWKSDLEAMTPDQLACDGCTLTPTMGHTCKELA